MNTFYLRDEYIKLGQLLKAAGYVESGVDAKECILRGDAKVNGEVSFQRGKKCYDGDVVEFDGQEILVKAGNNA